MNLKNRLEKIESKTDKSLVKIRFSDNTIKYLTFSELLKIITSNILNKEKSNKMSIKDFEIQHLQKDYGLLPNLIPTLIRIIECKKVSNLKNYQ